jgi:hypothetical protein
MAEGEEGYQKPRCAWLCVCENDMCDPEGGHTCSGKISPGRHCHSTLSLAVIGCRCLGILHSNLAVIASFSAKITLPPAPRQARLDHHARGRARAQAGGGVERGQGARGRAAGAVGGPGFREEMRRVHPVAEQLPRSVRVRTANSRGPGGPTGPLAPHRRPLGSSPDMESAIGNAFALVSGPLARL